MYLISSSCIVGSLSPAHSSTVLLREETSNARRPNSQRAFRGSFQTAGIWAHVTSSVLMAFYVVFCLHSMNTSIRMLHPRVFIKTTRRSDDCYANFQEHTRSFLYSVNFSLVLTYPFFLETSRGMFFVVFPAVTAVVWDTGSGRQRDCYDSSCLSQRRDWF